MTDEPAAGPVARLRVAIAYRWRHGRWPDLELPRLFTEHVQWRKLNDRTLDLALLTDKLVGKAIATDRLGADSVIPTLWSGAILPEEPPGPLPLVVKANHGCNQTIVVRSPDGWARARRTTPAWLRKAYGGWLDEWHYRAARRLLLVEPFVGPDDALPVDYKIYVFAGRAEMVQVHVDRGTSRHRWHQFDRRWRTISAGLGADLVRPPASIDRMMDAAEAMASGHDFLRVDFYEIDGRLLFGEYCLFPGSGLDPFDPPSIDERLGALWAGPEPSSAPVLTPLPA